MPRYELEDDCCVQCVACHMWCNPRDIGHASPGRCAFCDTIPEVHEAIESLRGVDRAAAGGDQECREAVAALCETIGATVRALRAMGGPPKNFPATGP